MTLRSAKKIIVDLEKVGFLCAFLIYLEKEGYLHQPMDNWNRQNCIKEFLEGKRHTIGNFGFDPVFMPSCAFDFQECIIQKAVKKGRIGVFADTGLGKTLIQLSIAHNIVLKTIQDPRQLLSQ